MQLSCEREVQNEKGTCKIISSMYGMELFDDTGSEGVWSRGR